MTAEIAVMNKHGVAIAADSAVTAGSGEDAKVFNTANKIFALSNRHPVGIMAFGGADFMGVPWEVVIKEYRCRLGLNDFDRLRDYATDFMRFLRDAKDLFPDSQRTRHFDESVSGYFLNRILAEIDRTLQKLAQTGAHIDQARIGQVVCRVIENHHGHWMRATLAEGVDAGTPSRIQQEFAKNIDDINRQVFEKLPLTSEDKQRLSEIASALFTKYPSVTFLRN